MMFVMLATGAHLIVENMAFNVALKRTCGVKTDLKRG